MNFNENDLWRYKTELLNLRLSKLPSTKVILELEFDTEDQVLYSNLITLNKAVESSASVFSALLEEQLGAGLKDYWISNIYFNISLSLLYQV